LHIGDVVFEAEDVFGDGVNVAARLEQLAEPGQIAISDTAYHSLDGVLASQFIGGNPHELKNVSRPVRVWRWPAISMGPSSVQKATPSSVIPDEITIAVLPFDNLSDGPDQEYFADGIAEDIITELYRYPVLVVIARNSSFSYKGQLVDIKKVGKELGAKYVLEGSVRRAASRVRVTAQLIEAETGTHIWAERYDRELEDIFSVQDEITQSVVGALYPEILEDLQRTARGKARDDLTAQDFLWRGNWHRSKLTQADAEKAQEYFLKSLEINPEMAPTHAFLANLESMKLFLGWQDDPQKAVQTAHSHANRAIQIDPRYSDAYLALTTTLILMQKWDEAERACRTAVQLTPNFAACYLMLGACHMWTSNPREAIKYCEKFRMLSPRDPWLHLVDNMLSVIFYRLRDYKKAAECAQSAIRRKHDYSLPYLNLLAALGQLNRLDEANEVIPTAKEYLTEASPDFFETAWPYADRTDFDHFISGLRKSGLVIK
jgi:TolB-like protein